MPQGRVDALVALRGEARAQEVEGVGRGGGGGAGGGAGEEGLGGAGEGVGGGGEVLQEEGGLSVGGEVDGVVEDVEELGGDVAFPEGGEAFLVEDGAEGAEGAEVGGAAAVGGAGGKGVGEGVGLELEADLDYVEGGDDEAGGGRVLVVVLRRRVWPRDGDVPGDEAGRGARCHDLEPRALILEGLGFGRHSHTRGLGRWMAGVWVARAVTRPGKAGVTERMRVQMVARSVGDGEGGGGQVARSRGGESRYPERNGCRFSQYFACVCCN